MGTGSQTRNEQKEIMGNIHQFVEEQLSTWKLAADNFKALDNVMVREIEVNGLKVKLQFNPARMISSAAKLTKEDIAKRKCFLCRENRPDVQMNIPFDGCYGHKYDVLINPYPIFPDHLVVAKSTHQDQAISARYEDMLTLVRRYDECTFYYNGPCCGASAPDHHHFQGVPRNIMPLELDIEAQCCKEDRLHKLISYNDAALYHYDFFSTGIFVIRSGSVDSASFLFNRLMSCADIPEGDIEPRINLFSWWTGEEYRTIVYFRRCHRSHHYFSDGPDHLTMSPGCADMAGIFIVPVEDEFYKITPELISDMISEITLPQDEHERIISRLLRTQPTLSVGIMSADEIEFEIKGGGLKKVVYKDGLIEYDGQLHKELYFKAEPSYKMFAEPFFTLHSVTIGVKFHWQRQENQTFAGDLKIIVDGNRLTAINVIGIEDYLLSVISSEMSATASEEFLKAHAVISRSWVMAQIESSGQHEDMPSNECLSDEYIKWYDHDDHSLFDVCADDHCQRYQGLTRATGETVRKVIDATWGQVLTYEGKLCDARFSKCCGGVMEKFSTCWQDKDYDYLQALPDSPEHDADAECFCNTTDKDILGQVLNNYDQETTDFFEWKECFDPVALGNLIERKSGHKTGAVKSLEPLERGESGRISRLRIVGELKPITVGKELEIRRILSETHLKSSAFDVEYTSDGMIVLNGRGWGHGVGLCQIGAAVMASRGYNYMDILQHYYPSSTVTVQE